MKQIPNMQDIDPRQPRVSAAITSIVALGAVVASFSEYAYLPILLYAYTTIIFLWSIVLRKAWHPYKAFFKFISRFIGSPKYLEDPRGPFFAQKVGLIVSFFAFIGALVFGPFVGAIFGSMLFIASSLNAYFNVCLGCIMYFRLKKIGVNL